VGAKSYFVSFWNYADIVNIILSLINIYMQVMVGPYEIQCRIIMCLMVINITVKTFFFLRIFPSLTPIVVMIQKVIYDLRIFLFFYTTMLFFFSLLFSVLGLGNENQKVKDDFEDTERMLRGKGGGGGGGTGGTGGGTGSEKGTLAFLLGGRDNGIDPLGVAKEYKSVGLLVGEFMWTFRISMGDFSAIAATKGLTRTETQIFWVIWFMTALMTCIIFLNFVVAEAMGSYEKVKEYLESVI
jgi:hypothetical protein